MGCTGCVHIAAIRVMRIWMFYREYNIGLGPYSFKQKMHSNVYLALCQEIKTLL